MSVCWLGNKNLKHTGQFYKLAAAINFTKSMGILMSTT